MNQGSKKTQIIVGTANSTSSVHGRLHQKIKQVNANFINKDGQCYATNIEV
jgi:hypothetical protein